MRGGGHGGRGVLSGRPLRVLLGVKKAWLREQAFTVSPFEDGSLKVEVGSSRGLQGRVCSRPAFGV